MAKPVARPTTKAPSTKADKTIGEVMLLEVRVSFTEVYERGKDTVNEEGETVPGKFKSNGLMEKGTRRGEANKALIVAACGRVKAAKWGANPPKLKPEKVCLRDGDLEDYDGYANNWFIVASDKNQPVLITKHKDSKGNWIPAKEGQIYSGCYCNMLVNIWAQDNKFGKRLNASLRALQFVRDGEAFSGAAPVDPNTHEKFLMIEADEGEDMALGSEYDYSEGEEDFSDLV